MDDPALHRYTKFTFGQQALVYECQLCSDKMRRNTYLTMNHLKKRHKMTNHQAAASITNAEKK